MSVETGSIGRVESRGLSNSSQQGTGSVSRRGRLDVDARREQLLEVGREFFSRRSYEEVWIDDIAKKAGVSKGLLYHYFPSKREFFVAAIRAEVEEIRARTAPRSDLPPEAQLRASLDVFLDYVEEHWPAFETMFQPGVGSDRELAEMLGRDDALQVDRVHAILTGGKPS